MKAATQDHFYRFVDIYRQNLSATKCGAQIKIKQRDPDTQCFSWCWHEIKIPNLSYLSPLCESIHLVCNSVLCPFWTCRPIADVSKFLECACLFLVFLLSFCCTDYYQQPEREERLKVPLNLNLKIIPVTL